VEVDTESQRSTLGPDAARSAAPALGLSIRPYFPATYEKAVDAVDKIDAKRSRRLYKTRWERAKRKRLRESSVEIVKLAIPRSLARRLHTWTPKGVGFHNFLLRVLSAGTGGKPLWESAEAFNRRAKAYETSKEWPQMSRNARCSCGSGLKYKRCCGQGK
jgi:hypothetical protein